MYSLIVCFKIDGISAPTKVHVSSSTYCLAFFLKSVGSSSTTAFDFLRVLTPPLSLRCDAYESDLNNLEKNPPLFFSAGPFSTIDIGFTIDDAPISIGTVSVSVSSLDTLTILLEVTFYILSVTFLGSVFLLSVATRCSISFIITFRRSMPTNLNLNRQLHSPE